jgi:hypothetical protein
MSEWWKYEPEDFLLFSPRVFHRLFELHNEALWPAPLLMLALGLILLWFMVRPSGHSERFVFAALGVLWVWVAWSFLWERYATINWASVYVAPVFVLQGLALIWMGAVRQRLEFDRSRGWIKLAACVLFALALVGYPTLAPLMGRPWLGAEIFGIAPDPTAIATLAALATTVRAPLWLLIVPVLWCALSGEVLALLNAPDFFVVLMLAGLGVALVIARRFSGLSGRGKS